MKSPSWHGPIGGAAGRKHAQKEAERYQRFVHCIDGIPWEADPDSLHFLFIGPQSDTILGLPPEELIQDPDAFFALIPEGDREALRNGLREAVRERTNHRFEFRIRRSDGSRRWLKMIVSVLTDHDRTVRLVGMMVDITDRKETESGMRERRSHQEHLNRVLVHLTRSQNLFKGDLKQRMQQLTEKAARALNVERVNAWLLRGASSWMDCLDHYEQGQDAHKPQPPLDLSQFPRYQEALKHSRMINIDDASNDPRSRELKEPYLGPHRIRSLLDAPIRVGGRLAGVICMEHTGSPRHWTPEEQQFAASVADMASLAIEAAERARAEDELRRAHDALEERVESRTEELRNLVNAMAGREVRMQELKETIRTLRGQLQEAGLQPVADDPLTAEEPP